MVGVFASFATQNHRTLKPGVTEFAVRAFCARNLHKSGPLQIGDQLTDFSRHRMDGTQAAVPWDAGGNRSMQRFTGNSPAERTVRHGSIEADAGTEHICELKFDGWQNAPPGGTNRNPAARIASTDQPQMRQALAAVTACFLRVRPLLRSLSLTNPMASYSSPFAVSAGSPFTPLTTTLIVSIAAVSASSR